ncbi:hypothetical protein AB3N60_14830 [Leptospira sp. WS39.C2]
MSIHFAKLKKVNIKTITNNLKISKLEYYFLTTFLILYSILLFYAGILYFLFDDSMVGSINISIGIILIASIVGLSKNSRISKYIILFFLIIHVLFLLVVFLIFIYISKDFNSNEFLLPKPQLENMIRNGLLYFIGLTTIFSYMLYIVFKSKTNKAKSNNNIEIS